MTAPLSRKELLSTSTTHLIRWPDGNDRLITMTDWHWHNLEKSKEMINMDLLDILEVCIIGATDAPTGRGFDIDLIDGLQMLAEYQPTQWALLGRGAAND